MIPDDRGSEVWEVSFGIAVIGAAERAGDVTAGPFIAIA